MENQEICSSCGGLCCKARPGHIFPNELKSQISSELLTELIDSGIYAFGFWGDPPNSPDSNSSRLYFLRFKGISSVNIIDNSRFSQCILLTENGCKRDYQERPDVCKALIPQSNYLCNFETDAFSVENCAIAWMPYQETIKKLLELRNAF